MLVSAAVTCTVFTSALSKFNTEPTAATTIDSTTLETLTDACSAFSETTTAATGTAIETATGAATSTLPTLAVVSPLISIVIVTVIVCTFTVAPSSNFGVEFTFNFFTATDTGAATVFTSPISDASAFTV